MTYPNISKPQIVEFNYNQPTNNNTTGQIGYAVNAQITKAKPRRAEVLFKFTGGEYEAFKLWYFEELKNGIKSFVTDWKDFDEVFFTEGSQMTIKKVSNDFYEISGMKIETVRGFR